LGARNWVLMDDAGWNSTNSAWQKAKDAGILTQAKWILLWIFMDFSFCIFLLKIILVISFDTFASFVWSGA